MGVLGRRPPGDGPKAQHDELQFAAFNGNTCREQHA